MTWHPETRVPSSLAPLLVGAVAALAALAGPAAPRAAADEAGSTYHFGTHAKHTNVTFVSEADLETIHGVTNTVRGTAWIDFEAKRARADLAVPVASMDTGIPLRNEHMRSEKWLDESKHPDVTFASDGFELTLRNRLDNGTEVYAAKAKGRLTVHGVTRDVEPEVTVTRLAPELAKRIGPGDWVRVVTSFEVKLSDHKVEVPGGPVQGKVSDVWKVTFNCFATTKPPEKR
jgi:polyisoprenoid-binding protein YceI